MRLRKYDKSEIVPGFVPASTRILRVTKQTIGPSVRYSRFDPGYCKDVRVVNSTHGEGPNLFKYYKIEKSTILDTTTSSKKKYYLKYIPVHRRQDTTHCRYLFRMLNIPKGHPCRPFSHTVVKRVYKWIPAAKLYGYNPVSHSKEESWIEVNNLRLFSDTVYQGTPVMRWYSRCRGGAMHYKKVESFEIDRLQPITDPPSPLIPGGTKVTHVSHSYIRYDVNDVYRRANNGLKKISKITMATEANMFVQMMEIKQLMSLFSIAGLRFLGPLGTISALFLQYSFAIAPTIDDYRKVVSMADKLKKNIDAWNAKAGKMVTYHIHLPTLQTTVKTDVGHAGAVWDRNRDVQTRGVITATVVPRKITVSQSTIAIANLGFDKPLSALWEILPFSFIVDWFTDVGGFINSFETAQSPAQFDLISIGYSEKMTSVVKSSNFRTDQHLHMDTVIHNMGSRFNRTLLNEQLLMDRDFLASLDAWVPSSRFGVKQALLATALAITLNPRLGRM